MELDPLLELLRNLEYRNRNRAGQQRARHPGREDLDHRARVSDGIAEQVPTDDSADDGLAGGNREPPLGHDVHRDGRGQRNHESAGQGIDGAKLPESVAGAGATDNGTENHEHAAYQRCRREANHARTHRGAKDVRGVVGTQRPTEKQPAGEEKENSEIHCRVFWTSS